MENQKTDRQLTSKYFFQSLRRTWWLLPIIALAAYAIYTIALPIYGTAMALILGMLASAIMVMLVVGILG